MTSNKSHHVCLEGPRVAHAFVSMKLAASFALIVALFATSASARDVVIHAGTLLDGVTDSPRREVSILIRDDRITAVEPGFVKPAGSEIIDLSGTYKDSPAGPFAGGKTINRDNYRMLGAIIQTKDRGNYFLKLYGPKATIDENEKGFQEMVKSLKVK